MDSLCELSVIVMACIWPFDCPSLMVLELSEVNLKMSLGSLRDWWLFSKDPKSNALEDPTEKRMGLYSHRARDSFTVKSFKISSDLVARSILS